MKAVILAAGEGTRLRPFTHTKPKPLIPVAEKPIIEFLIDGLTSAGVNEIYIVVEHLKNQFKYLEEEYEGIKLIEQGEAEGTADAVSKVSFLNESSLVLNGDIILSKRDISSIIEKHRKSKGKVTIGVSKVENPKEYGIIGKKGSKVENIVEKPSDPESNLANAGIYGLEPEIFDFIDKTERSERGEFELTDSIKLAIKNNADVNYCVINDYWLDVGNPWDLLKGQEFKIEERIYDRNEEKGEVRGFVKGDVFTGEGAVIERGAKVIGPVYIGEETTIASGTYLRGPAIIGKNCFIGPFSHVRKYSSIGDNCKLGNASEVKRSIVMNDSNVPHLNYVGDSVVGEHVNLAGGTIIANLRHDNEAIKVKVKDEMKDAERKTGAFIADYVKTGANTSIYPGRKLGPFSWTSPGSKVKDNLKPFRVLKEEGTCKIPEEKIGNVVNDEEKKQLLKELYKELS